MNKDAYYYWCPFGKHAQMKNNFIFFEGDAMLW